MCILIGLDWIGLVGLVGLIEAGFFLWQLPRGMGAHALAGKRVSIAIENFALQGCKTRYSAMHRTTRLVETAIPPWGDVSCSIAALECGDPQGPLVLLLHGWPGVADEFHPLMECIHAQDPSLHLVAPYYPSHGQSSPLLFCTRIPTNK